jgi:hypothetical protein
MISHTFTLLPEAKLPFESNLRREKTLFRIVALQLLQSGCYFSPHAKAKRLDDGPGMAFATLKP